MKSRWKKEHNEMTERERLIELLKNVPKNTRVFYDQYADWLLANGVIVPPCKVGDVVYFLLEDNFPVHRWYISEETVTEICSKGIFTSGYYPPRDDLENYSSYDLFGEEIFLTRETAEAKQALKARDEGK